MTEKQNWQFRSEYLRMQAIGFRSQAEALLHQAQRLESLAATADKIAEDITVFKSN